MLDIRREPGLSPAGYPFVSLETHTDVLRATVPKRIDVMHKALLSVDTRTVQKCLVDGFRVNGRFPTRNGRLQRETPLMIATELGNCM
jgi:hypothetical protein